MTRALEVAVAARGGEGALPGIDRADARARVVDGDWIFRQLALYELGGLAAFLRSAPADLVSGADRIRGVGSLRRCRGCGWCLAARGRHVGGPRDRGATVTSTTSARRRWRCSASAWSGASCRSPRDCAWMFESAPLVVAESVAQAVAGAPADWLELVTAGVQRRGRPMSQAGFEFAMLTDVPRVVWLHVLLEDREVPTWPRPGRCCSRAAGPRLGGAGRDGAQSPRDRTRWSCGPASSPPCSTRSCWMGSRGALATADLPTLVALAELLPHPAAAVCEDLRDRLLTRERPGLCVDCYTLLHGSRRLARSPQPHRRGAAAGGGRASGSA